VRAHVVNHFGDPDAVLVADETGFLKKGAASCGVSRQYTGPAGKITNYQIGVFATYVSDKGHAFLDRALYLPRSWTDTNRNGWRQSAVFHDLMPTWDAARNTRARRRHALRIEEGFETAKNAFGPDHNEIRSWHGWHRHVSLVMLADAMMAAVRYQANAPAPEKR